MSKFKKKQRKRSSKVQSLHFNTDVKKLCKDTINPSVSLKPANQTLDNININKHRKRNISADDTIQNKGLKTKSSFNYVDDNIQIAWLDIKNNNSLVHPARSHLIANYLKLFDNADIFIGYLVSLNSNKKTKIILVLSDTQSKQIIPLIYERPQIFSIYIYCVNQKTHEGWIQNHSNKIKGIFIDTNELIAQLNEEIMFYSKTISMSIMPSLNFGVGQTSLRNFNKQQSSFMWYQLLIDVLKRLPPTSISQNDTLTDCRLEYSDHDTKLSEIQEFEETYHSENVIAWYTRDTFLYRLLNKALRTKDINVIFKFRFVLIDLYDRLTQLHSKYIDSLKSQNVTMSELIVFHGQGLTLTELENLKNNVNNRTLMNSFLCTSTSREVAMLSAGDGPGRPIIESVFFEIHCPIKNYVKKPFANIQQYTYLKKSDEILFNIGTIFYIDFVEKLTEQIWRVKLTLCNDENDFIVNELVNKLASDIENTLEISPLLDLLLNMNEIDKVKNFYDIILQALPLDHHDRISVKNNIGKIHLSQGNYSIALRCFKEALDINRKLKPQDFKSISSIMNNIGNGYKELCKYSQAIKYYQKALRSQKHLVVNNDLELATTFNNLGIVYTSLSNYRLSLKYHQKAKRIRVNSFPKTHLDPSETFINIGEIYLSKGYLKLARIKFERGLDIKLQSIAADHSSLATIYKSLVCIYGQLGNVEKTLEYQKKCLNTCFKSIENNHPDLAHLYITIARCYTGVEDFNAALFYQKKALKIRLRSLPNCHLHIIKSYIQIGILYRFKKRYKLALKHLKKAHDKLSPSINKDLLVSIYYQLGKLYADKSNSRMVIKYYKKAINLQLKCKESATNPDLAMIYSSLGEFYLKNNDTKKASVQLKKALKIGENCLKFDDTTIQQVLPTIVHVLMAKKNYTTALKYAIRLLKILRKDPTIVVNDLATAYFDIACIHSCKHNDQKAILNYRKTLKYLKQANLESSSLNTVMPVLMYQDLGKIYADKSDSKMAIKYYKRAITHQLKYDQSNTDYGLALTYILLGRVYLKIDDTTNALIQFMKALEIQENCLEFDDETFRIVLSTIVEVLQIKQDYTTALEYATRLLNLQKKDLTTTKDDLATTYFDIGYTYYRMHNDEKARLNYRTALKYASSTNPNRDQLYYGLALVYHDRKKHKEALVNYKKVLQYFSNSADLVASTYNNIGVIYCLQYKYDKARYNYGMALEIEETDLELASAAFYNLGLIDHIEEEYLSALESYQMALDIIKEYEVEDENILIKIYNNMGGIYNLISNYDEQLNCYQKVLSLELKSNKGSQNHGTITTIYINLGKVYFRQCNYSAALQSFEKALTVASKSMTSDHRHIAEYRNYISLTTNHLQSKASTNSTDGMVIENMVSYIPHRTIARQFYQTSKYRTNETLLIGRQSLSWKNALFKTKKSKQKKSSYKSKQDASDVDNDQMTDDSSNFIFEEKQNLDDSIIIWLRSTDTNYIESTSRLRSIVNRVKTFRTPVTYLNYTYLLQNEKIFLIIPSSFIMDILSYIDEPLEIQCVYIFGYVEETYGQELQKKHSKIRGIYNDMETLAVQLTNDVINRSKMVVHLSVFTTNKEECSTKDLKKEKPSRMWFNLLIEILLRMPQATIARDEMIAECKLFYVDNPVELKKVADFQANYLPTDAIKWYTYDCFLFRQLNKACRTKNIDALYKLRFFLVDLENELQELFKSQFDHTTPTFTVYRGQLIAPNELHKLKENAGNLVSMNTYLSTTKSCPVASNYAGNGSGHPFIESVVFEIEVDVKKAVKPFADIQQVSIMKDEGEVLFSIRTVFKIESVDEVLDNVWFVKLTLSKDEDKELKRLENYFINQIGQTSNLDILRNYLYISGEHDQAEKFSKTMIKSMIHNLTVTFGPSEKYFNPFETIPDEQSYTSARDKRENELPENTDALSVNDPTVLESYNNAGILNTTKGNYSEALVCFQKALQYQEQYAPNDFTSIANIYQNIAIVYESQDDYLTTLKNLKSALQIQKQTKPLNYPRLATMFRYIAECYAIQHKLILALRFYRKSIHMFAKYLPLNHPTFAELQSALGDVYNDSQRYHDALKHYRRALSIAKKVLPPDHLELLCYQEKIDDFKEGSVRLPPVVHMHWMGEYLRA